MCQLLNVTGINSYNILQILLLIEPGAVQNLDPVKYDLRALKNFCKLSSNHHPTTEYYTLERGYVTKIKTLEI